MNDSDWFLLDDDVRCQFSVPSKGNANLARVQHFIHHLAPGRTATAGDLAGFVLANGRMSSNQSDESDIRTHITSRKPVSICMRNQTTDLEVAA